MIYILSYSDGFGGKKLFTGTEYHTVSYGLLTNGTRSDAMVQELFRFVFSKQKINKEIRLSIRLDLTCVVQLYENNPKNIYINPERKIRF